MLHPLAPQGTVNGLLQQQALEQGPMTRRRRVAKVEFGLNIDPFSMPTLQTIEQQLNLSVMDSIMPSSSSLHTASPAMQRVAVAAASPAPVPRYVWVMFFTVCSSSFRHHTSHRPQSSLLTSPLPFQSPTRKRKAEHANHFGGVPGLGIGGGDMGFVPSPMFSPPYSAFSSKMRMSPQSVQQPRLDFSPAASGKKQRRDSFVPQQSPIPIGLSGFGGGMMTLTTATAASEMTSPFPRHIRESGDDGVTLAPPPTSLPGPVPSLSTGGPGRQRLSLAGAPILSDVTPKPFSRTTRPLLAQSPFQA